tara:strand:- start:179 stop:427 length:249 start_codon:yes stop_codon:yes gene_type:complete
MSVEIQESLEREVTAEAEADHKKEDIIKKITEANEATRVHMIVDRKIKKKIEKDLIHPKMTLNQEAQAPLKVMTKIVNLKGI